MTHQLYATYDKVTALYNAPFRSVNEATATRMFSQWIKSPEANWAEDIDLYYIGTFDDESGMLTQDANPKLIIKGGQLIAITEQE